MKTLITGVGSYLTGDAIAVAVLEYWRRLAEHHLVDLVDLPFRREDGSRARVQLTIGWASELAAVDSASGGSPELADAAFVDDLERRTRSRARVAEHPDVRPSPAFELDGLSFLDGY